jgi:hypothetical protein
MSNLLGNKQFAYVVLIVGLILLLLSLLYDPIRGVTFYLAVYQIIGLIVGVILALIGAYLAFFYKIATED